MWIRLRPIAVLPERDPEKVSKYFEIVGRVYISFCRYFELQLNLNESLNLPLFLHCRNAAGDLYDILSKYAFKGVVHSFDGSIQEATRFIDLGYYIGVNGW